MKVKHLRFYTAHMKKDQVELTDFSMSGLVRFTSHCPILWTCLWSKQSSPSDDTTSIWVVNALIAPWSTNYSAGNRSVRARMCWHVLVRRSSADAWRLIEDGDLVGQAVGGGGNGGGVKRGVIRHLWALAGSTELAGQRLIQVDFGGQHAAAVEVQVVLAAQLALLAQWWLAGSALLLHVAARERKSMKGGVEPILWLNKIARATCKLKRSKKMLQRGHYSIWDGDLKPQHTFLEICKAGSGIRKERGP